MIKYFRFFLTISFVFSSHCFSMDKNLLIEGIEQQDISKVISFFDEIETITLEEAHELVTSFYGVYISKFGPEILNNKEYMTILEQSTAIYHSILESHGITFENNLINYEKNSFPSILFCKSKKKKNYELQMQEEIPGSMILGAVEILGGSLVWILPFPGTKVVGGAMIGDGIRRA